MFQDGVKKTISTKQVQPSPKFRPSQTHRTTWVTQRSTCKHVKKYDTPKHWFPSLPFQQFQVLFNSLFKVLCIFPSRYLCAIGLPPIFSLRWNLPPTLSCNPKQLDSHMFCNIQNQPNGSITLYAALFQGTLASKGMLNTTTIRSVGAFPASVALTTGILVSFFSSA